MNTQATNNMVFEFKAGKSGVWYAKAENDEFTISIRTRAWDEKSKRTRLYVAGEEPVDFTAAYEADRADGGPQPRGQRPEVDKLFDALNRQVVKNQKKVALEAVASIPALAELIEDCKMTFSKKAGCSCGCSPAFILDQTIMVPTDMGARFVSSIAIEKKPAAE